MKRKSSILGGVEPALGALMCAGVVLGFWVAFASSSELAFGWWLPLPGLISAVAIGVLAVLQRRKWSRILAPRAEADLGDRDCAVEGVLRRLDASLISPYTERECVAWRGWFVPRGDARYDEFARAVPFVLELPGGRALAVRLNEGDEGVRIWNHLGHEEELVCAKGEASLTAEALDRVRAFLGFTDSRRYVPNLRPTRELIYADGDLVVLAGRFRRLEDTATFRAIKGLPFYEVSGDVVFAKGPASVHRRLFSPWLRARWTLYLAAACGIEAATLLVLMLITVWVDLAW